MNLYANNNEHIWTCNYSYSTITSFEELKDTINHYILNDSWIDYVGLTYPCLLIIDNDTSIARAIGKEKFLKLLSFCDNNKDDKE